MTILTALLIATLTTTPIQSIQSTDTGALITCIDGSGYYIGQ